MQLIKFKLEALCMKTCFKFSLNFYCGIKFLHSTISNKPYGPSVQIFQIQIISFWFQCGQQKNSTGSWFKQMVYFNTVDLSKETNFNHVSYRTCSIELSIEHFLSTEMYQNLVKQGSMDVSGFKMFWNGSYLINDYALDVFQIQSDTQNSSSYSGTKCSIHVAIEIFQRSIRDLLRALSYIQAEFRGF